MADFDELQTRLNKPIGILMGKGWKNRELFKSLSAVFSKSTAFNNRQIEESAALRRQPAEKACGPRCCECCYRMPYIWSMIEDKYVWEGLRFMSASLKERIKVKTESALEDWTDLKLAHGMTKAADPVVLHHDWNGMRVPCPLLSDEGMCHIYRNCPFDCQITSVWNQPCTDPSQCGCLHPLSGIHKGVVDLCHKIDAKHGWNYSPRPLVEALASWLG